jgi:hypothetical protein
MGRGSAVGPFIDLVKYAGSVADEIAIDLEFSRWARGQLIDPLLGMMLDLCIGQASFAPFHERWCYSK